MNKYLKIYLQDHYAGATAGCNLAVRAAENNKDSHLGSELTAIAGEICEDRVALHEMLHRFNEESDALKDLGGFLGEKIGRLKMNGNLFEYSPLSRVIELEALVIGVSGKCALWRSLLAVEATVPELNKIELEKLLSRAEDQLERLEDLRLSAAEVALDGTFADPIREREAEMMA